MVAVTLEAGLGGEEQQKDPRGHQRDITCHTPPPLHTSYAFWAFGLAAAIITRKRAPNCRCREHRDLNASTALESPPLIYQQQIFLLIVWTAGARTR